MNLTFPEPPLHTDLPCYYLALLTSRFDWSLHILESQGLYRSIQPSLMPIQTSRTVAEKDGSIESPKPRKVLPVRDFISPPCSPARTSIVVQTTSLPAPSGASRDELDQQRHRGLLHAHPRIHQRRSAYEATPHRIATLATSHVLPGSRTTSPERLLSPYLSPVIDDVSRGGGGLFICRWVSFHLASACPGLALLSAHGFFLSTRCIFHRSLLCPAGFRLR